MKEAVTSLIQDISALNESMADFVATLKVA